MNLVHTAIKHHTLAKRKAGAVPVHQWAKKHQNAPGETGHQARMVAAMHALHTADAANGPGEKLAAKTAEQEGQQ